ncbi:phage portal protein [Bradyrhizobium sp. AZCC 1610]|uniref:phage portal protein n=1 Tax=Bradyrhizobium sp. AZCC 1610 TaxID=3117020 RepID=UPI002FF01CA0
MSLVSKFKSLVGIETKSGIASPDAWLSDLFGATPSAAGISVTPRSAMTCPPVRAAVAAISEPIGTLPFHVYRRTGEGKERAPDHPVHKLLHDQVNDWTSASDFRETVTRDALLHPAGGLAYIARNAEHKPISLFRLNPETVEVSVDPFEGPAYKITEGGKSRAIPAADILHIPSPAMTGRGLVAEARDAIGLTMLLERHASKLFANNARPSGVLSIKGAASADALAKVKAAWVAAHGGDKSGGTAVIPSDAEWRALTMTSVDAQFLELRAFQINEIARVFRVPPHMLFEMGRATWGNSESMRQDFLDFSLMRWITAWENEVALKLLTADERKTYFAEFLVDGFVRSDLVKRTQAFTAAVGGPWLLANEARAAENRAPVAGGDKLLPPPNATGVSAA